MKIIVTHMHGTLEIERFGNATFATIKRHPEWSKATRKEEPFEDVRLSLSEEQVAELRKALVVIQ